jgi:hypothetical protein
MMPDFLMPLSRRLPGSLPALYFFSIGCRLMLPVFSLIWPNLVSRSPPD